MAERMGGVLANSQAEWIDVDSSFGESGQDMIEYALLAALISIVAIGIILLIGPYLQSLFQDVVNGLSSA